MAGRRLTASDILERLDNDEFDLSSGEESDFEGEGVFSYRPPGLEDPLDGLVDREREVLKGKWLRQENVFSQHPFNGPTPGPTSPSSGVSASDCFSRFFTEELIGSFTSRQRAVGPPRSLEHQQILMLDSTQSHLPIIDRPSRKCVVCNKVREVRKLTLSEYCHETNIKCTVCDVNLCVTNCFVKYHTTVRYWE